VEHRFANGNGSEIVNVTHPSHKLHPGIVRRWITEDEGSITIHTYGEGTGPLPDENEFFSDSVWRGADEDAMEFAKNAE